MFRILLLKELREIWWIGLLVLLAMLYGVALEVDFGSRPGGRGYGFLRYTEVNTFHKPPLVDGSFARTVLLWGIILAAVLGSWQTFRETQSRTWHFLLYRPVDRVLILWAKVLAAALLFGLAICLPAFTVMAWAATPRAHASPFHWLLTAPVWYALAACPVVYFAALFAGLRRSHLAGCRWWPLIGVVIVFCALPLNLPNQFTVWMSGLLVIWTLLMVVQVRDELRAADFS